MNRITSPRVDESGIEAEIQAKGKTAPRVTPAGIDAVIASEHSPPNKTPESTT